MMTKELAIKILCGDTIGTIEQTHEAVWMAVKAITEQKHGHWNKKYYDDEWFQYCCSYCDGITIYKYPFCPHCGAKMDEVEDGKTD